MIEILVFIAFWTGITAGMTRMLLQHLKRLKQTKMPDFPDAGPQSLEDGRWRRVGMMDRRINVTFTVLVIPSCVLAYVLLQRAQGLRVSLLGPALLTIPIPNVYWIVASVLLGVGMAFAIFLPVSQTLWPDDMPWYLLYVARLRSGCDYARLCRAISLFLLSLGLLMVPLGVNYYTQVRRDGFVMHRYFSLAESRYAFGDIRSIVASNYHITLRHGDAVATGGWRMRVTFVNGDYWEPNPFDLDDAEHDFAVERVLPSQAHILVSIVPVFPWTQGIDRL